MEKDVEEVLDEFEAYLRKMRKEMPEPVDQFLGLLRSVYKKGVLSSKTKELISIGISISQGCIPCMVLHTKAALDAGASKGEIMESCAVALEMGGGPALAHIPVIMKTIEKFQK